MDARAPGHARAWDAIVWEARAAQCLGTHSLARTPIRALERALPSAWIEHFYFC